MVEQRCPLTLGDAPTGFEIGKTAKQIFAGCKKVLVNVNIENGK